MVRIVVILFFVELLLIVIRYDFVFVGKFNFC